MRVNSLKELEKELQKRIDIALLNDVYETVRDVMVDHIIEDVYEKYESRYYERRYNDDGLLDPENIIAATLKGELAIQNVTLGTDTFYKKNNRYYTSQNANKYITPVIETGIGYDVDSWEYYGIPRPFMQNTHDDLEKNHYHTHSLKIGLQKQGLEVK